MLLLSGEVPEGGVTLPDELKKWPEDAFEAYKERLAIMIEDGKVPPLKARALAKKRIQREWRKK